jgi:hypothetical protein
MAGQREARDPAIHSQKCANKNAEGPVGNHRAFCFILPVLPTAVSGQRPKRPPGQERTFPIS